MIDAVKGPLGRLRATARRSRRRSQRWALRALLDFKDFRAGTRDPLVPPRRLNLPSQFTAVGERFVGLLKEAGGLEPDSNVLDVGCGPGRTAAPLARFLSSSGSYEGFDVMPKSIAWGSKKITPRYPNFHFQLADIHNGEYNAAGSQRASEYRFPYDDAGFDVALACSLFTHLRPFESEHYLAEVARTLRPGGRLLGTWFLLNEESETAVAAGRVPRPGYESGGRPPLSLEHELTDEGGHTFRSFNPEVPEHMIVVDEQLIREFHERAGLRVVEVRYGKWAAREAEGAFGQDVIIAERGPA